MEGWFFKRRKRKAFLAIDVVGRKLCGKRGKRAEECVLELPQTPENRCGKIARFLNKKEKVFASMVGTKMSNLYRSFLKAFSIPLAHTNLLFHCGYNLTLFANTFSVLGL